MLIALPAVAFACFVAALVLGVRWLLGLDTNTPDTLLSLRLRAFTRALERMQQQLGEALLEPVRRAAEHLAAFAVEFRRSPAYELARAWGYRTVITPDGDEPL